MASEEYGWPYVRLLHGSRLRHDPTRTGTRPGRQTLQDYNYDMVRYFCGITSVQILFAQFVAIPACFRLFSCTCSCAAPASPLGIAGATCA